MYDLGTTVAGIGAVVGCAFAAGIIGVFIGSLFKKSDVAVGIFFVAFIALMFLVDSKL